MAASNVVKFPSPAERERAAAAEQTARIMATYYRLTPANQAIFRAMVQAMVDSPRSPA